MSPEEPRLARGTDPTLRVLVAVPIPLQRSLVQFFMQEAGFELLPIPLPNVNVAKVAAHDHPDAIVLHESVAKPWDSGLVSEVRRDSPSTRIVVLAQAPDEAWAGPARGADAYLEEWVGIAELEGVLRDLCPVGSTPLAAASAQTTETAPEALLVAERAEQETPMPAAPARARGGRWYERIQGAAAAAIILFALLRGPAMFQETASIQGQSGGADAGLTDAYTSLGLLVYDLQQGSPPVGPHQGRERSSRCTDGRPLRGRGRQRPRCQDLHRSSAPAFECARRNRFRDSRCPRGAGGPALSFAGAEPERAPDPDRDPERVPCAERVPHPD